MVSGTMHGIGADGSEAEIGPIAASRRVCNRAAVAWQLASSHPTSSSAGTATPSS